MSDPSTQAPTPNQEALAQGRPERSATFRGGESKDDDQTKRIIEALLFASEHPVTLQQFTEVLKTDAAAVTAAIEALRLGYAQAGCAFTIVQVAGGYQMATDPQYAPWIKKLFRGLAQDKVTTPALETLAIIAYRQPITRVEIEALRGVNVDGVIHTLLERGLIKILGRKEAVGRPMLYGTTKEFLQHFGLNSLADLPHMEELTQPGQQVAQPTAAAAEQLGVEQAPPFCKSGTAVAEAEQMSKRAGQAASTHAETSPRESTETIPPQN